MEQKLTKRLVDSWINTATKDASSRLSSTSTYNLEQKNLAVDTLIKLLVIKDQVDG